MNEKTLDRLATILGITIGMVTVSVIGFWALGIQRQIRIARMMRAATERADIKLWDDEYYED